MTVLLLFQVKVLPRFQRSDCYLGIIRDTYGRNWTVQNPTWQLLLKMAASDRVLLYLVQFASYHGNCNAILPRGARDNICTWDTLNQLLLGREPCDTELTFQPQPFWRRGGGGTHSSSAFVHLFIETFIHRLSFWFKAAHNNSWNSSSLKPKTKIASPQIPLLRIGRTCSAKGLVCHCKDKSGSIFDLLTFCTTRSTWVSWKVVC